ncbi:MAG: PKD domain-containing protein [Anaerolineae bacterium]|nr:PKD domain-containing protein [Anaerolineae bacterium]MCB9102993.1 PKD domain-containing protein [Anaerolineales bacterium]
MSNNKGFLSSWSTIEKLLLGAVLLLCVLAGLVAVFLGGEFFVREERAQSDQTPTVVAGLATATVPAVESAPLPDANGDQETDELTAPAITLDPSAGQPGSTVTVTGENWPAGSRVVVSLVPSDPPAFTVNSAVVDQDGRFSVEIIVPTDTRWLDESPVPVLVTTDDNTIRAQAMLTIVTPDGGAPPPTPGSSNNNVIIISPDPNASRTPPPPAVAQLTTTANLNVRSGPGTNFDILGVLLLGQSAEIIGRNAESTWWQIKFPSATQDFGWVSAQYVQASNIANVPIVFVPPPPTPTPPPPTATPEPGVVITDWRGEYFDNDSLSGSPALVRNDVAISFDWGLGSPAPGIIPVDFFSVRWTRTLNFAAGTYRFFTRTDDGVRLWVDGALLINQWNEQSPTTFAADIFLTEGNHDIRMEYNELTGGAVAVLSWQRIDTFPDWKAEYFSNPDLAGAPVLIRNEGSINYNWNGNSPGPGVPGENFSARWTRQVPFDGGDYLFRITSDDGHRLWIDNDLISDRWQGGPTGVIEIQRNVSSGIHQLRVEYFQRVRESYIGFSWQRTDRPQQGPIAVIRSPSEGVTGQPVRFDGGRSRQGDSPIDRYEWDFDDGTRTKGKRVDHTFDDPGTYRVRLRVTDQNGLRDTTDVRITIKDDVEETTFPTAILDGPSTGTVGQPVAFSGNRSFSLSPITEYNWSFGDGTTARGPQVSHTYSQEGSYNVVLTVVAQNGLRSSDNLSIRIDSALNPGDAPVAKINAPQEAQWGQEIVFDGSGSTSKNQIVSWAWDFGDGSSANGPTVPHVYNRPATRSDLVIYNVRLTVTDQNGLENTATHLINLVDPPPPSEPPKAAISGPSTAEVGQAVTFDGAGSQSSNPITSYAWDFGDGSTGSGAQVNHTYTTNGDFTVTLEVTDDQNQTGSTTSPIQVSPQPTPVPLTANISGPSQGQVNQSLTFDAQSSTSAAPLTDIQWDFGDGNTDSGNLVVSHAYDAPGNYTVLLTLNNELGQSNTTAQAVVISEPPPANTPPQPAIQANPTTIQVGDTVNFDASGTQASSPIVSYDWDFGDGDTGSGQLTNHTYTQEGDYTVTLNVTDQNNLSGSTTAAITVNPLTQPDPLTANITGPAGGEVGEQLTFDGQSSTSAAPLTTIQWDFGDGATAGGNLVVNHTYKQPGDYTVQLTLENDINQNDTTSWSVTIDPATATILPAPTATAQPAQPPVAQINGPTQAEVGETVVFDGGYSQADSPIVSFEWGFGDGQTATGMGVTHVYGAPGTYNVTLTVTDQNGLSETDSYDIDIIDANGPPPPPPTQEPTPAPDEPTPTAAPEPEPTATPEPQPETRPLLPATPPTAAIDAPAQVQAGKPVTFSAQNSTPGSGQIIDYQWGFGDGGSDSGQTVTYVYQTQGNYQVTLTVADENGLSDTTAVPIFVGPSDEDIAAQQQAEEAQRQAEQQAQQQAEEQARQQAEQQAAAEATAQAQQDAAAQATAQAEQQAADEAQRQAEEAQRQADAEAQRQAEAEAQRQAAEEAQRQAEEAQRQAEEEAQRQAAEEAQRQAEEEAQRQAEEEARQAAEAAQQQQQQQGQPIPTDEPLPDDGN